MDEESLSSPVLQFPMISEFGEERILCCSCEPSIKDTSVIQSETTNLQQRINSLTQEVPCNIISIVLLGVEATLAASERGGQEIIVGWDEMNNGEKWEGAGC